MFVLKLLCHQFLNSNFRRQRGGDLLVDLLTRDSEGRLVNSGRIAFKKKKHA